jgi:tRNA(adenine34) deaminase
MKQEGDEYFMKQALREAQKAYEQGEVPIGAVIVIENKIIAKGYNQVEKLNDPTAHAEILAITSACGQLGAKYLSNAALYVTIEPCIMCSGAMYWSKIARVVYGAADAKNGYKHITQSNSPFHPKTKVVEGVLPHECAALMQQFFQQLR